MKPHCCPVCIGRGTVPLGFYNPYPTGTASNTAPETCRACGGTGILWDMDPIISGVPMTVSVQLAPTTDKEQP